MGTETERKYLVTSGDYPKQHPVKITQGFISTDKSKVVRVRLTENKATLTIKSGNHSLMRKEFEYDIPVEDARILLAEICIKPVIEKTRYTINLADLTWEIDFFHGLNEGLVIAEVELQDTGQAIQLPDWVGQEVTGDPKYYNANLVKMPYSLW
ncbi:MAG: CYTH domain-containing protein [Bacteroidales bacterium]|nr:CYTH domain-containing protein [Bacteroidales bacterium]